MWLVVDAVDTLNPRRELGELGELPAKQRHAMLALQNQVRNTPAALQLLKWGIVREFMVCPPLGVRKHTICVSFTVVFS